MSLLSISPIDGRYSNKTMVLSKYFSEMALMRYRVFAEIKYLIKLNEISSFNMKKFTEEEINELKKIIELTEDDANIIKSIETKGYKDIPATNHDVKAIEYFIKTKLTGSKFKDVLEFVHLALTSEDINNISYGLMIKDSINEIVFPELLKIYDLFYQMALKYKKIPMLARTHGQPATPTTFGKEILVFVSRLKNEFKLLSESFILMKLNGATGNFNAHNFILPDYDWSKFSKELINEFNSKNDEYKTKYIKKYPIKVEYNPVTTQIEPHDSYIRVFDIFKRINNILLDFCMDIWRYISDGWIKQKPVAGEIGSSAMPHKVNPIDFENAEGNLGIANSMFGFFASKLPVSRLQRDLSDSTVQRNIGVAFAHCLIAYQSIIKGLSKIEINDKLIIDTLNNTPEVLAEPFQNLLRISGVDKPYELLKDITRGKNVTIEDFQNLASKLEILPQLKERLLSITPEKYTGIAEKTVDSFDPEISPQS